MSIQPAASTLALAMELKERMAELDPQAMFGPWLREQRRAKGLRLREVAGSLGLSIPYISDIERGRRCPMGTEYARELASVLETEEAEIVARIVVGRVAWRQAAKGKTT